MGIGLSLGGRGLVPPAPAATWGYNRRTFSSRFNDLSKIDTTNSKVAGFDWYIQNAWPQAQLAPSGNLGWANMGVNGGSIVSGAASNSSFFSTANNIMSIKDTTANGVAWQLHTCCPTGTGTTLVGQTFSNGGYFECVHSCDPSLALSGMATWPAFWSVDTRWLLGQITRFAELDFFEVFPTSNAAPELDFSVHDWNLGVNPGTDTFNNTSNKVTPGVTDSVFYTFGTLWVPTTQNGGTGLVQRYFNGVHMSSVDQTYTSSGTWSPLDAAQLMLIIAGGPSWTSRYLSVDVWQQ